MKQNERVDAELARRTFDSFNLRTPPLTLEELRDLLIRILQVGGFCCQFSVTVDVIFRKSISRVDSNRFAGQLCKSWRQAAPPFFGVATMVGRA